MTKQSTTERPILFSAPMVRAILDGRKTQTRRIVKPMSGLQSTWLTQETIGEVPHGKMVSGGWQMHHPQAGKHYMGVDVPHDSPLGWIRCPYGLPGDRLWVRETWYSDSASRALLGFAADGDHPHGKAYRVKPSIHMPRWASRITLEVTGVRVERVQEISRDDALAEGVDLSSDPFPTINAPDKALARFPVLWDKINARRGYGWDKNPWVWVVEFRRCAP